MFPLTLTNNLKLLPNQSNITENLNDNSIKDRILQCLGQCLPNKSGVKVNAIIVIEADNEQKRTICINENVNSNNSVTINSNHVGNNFQITTPFQFTTSTNPNNSQNNTGLIFSQPPIFPATVDDLQAFLQIATPTLMRFNGLENNINQNQSNLTVQNPKISKLDCSNSSQQNPNSTSNDSTMSNSTFISNNNSTMNFTTNNNNDKSQEMNENNSRKRKAEKPCKIPQDYGLDSNNGLDLSVNYNKQENTQSLEPDKRLENFFANSLSTWPFSSNKTNIFNAPNHVNPIKPKRTTQMAGHKKSSKVFNCNQCKLQFNSLTSLCKHTFSEHRAFRCTHCGANFTQRSNLQRHSLKHVGFKPFVCNVCEKAYYRKDHLVRHIEVSHPGCDPKSSITVKLSSSECLEYLERMENVRLAEVDSGQTPILNGIGSINNANEINSITTQLHIKNEPETVTESAEETNPSFLNKNDNLNDSTDEISLENNTIPDIENIVVNPLENEANDQIKVEESPISIIPEIHIKDNESTKDEPNKLQPNKLELLSNEVYSNINNNNNNNEISIENSSTTNKFLESSNSTIIKTDNCI